MTAWTVGQPCVVAIGNGSRSATIASIGRKYVHVKVNDWRAPYRFGRETGRFAGEAYGATPRLFTVEGHVTERRREAAETAMRGLLDRWRRTTFTNEQLDELTAAIERIPK